MCGPPWGMVVFSVEVPIDVPQGQGGEPDEEDD